MNEVKTGAKDLVRMLMEGDCAALEQVYVNYRNYVIKVARRFLWDAQNAEDVCQEVFIVVHLRVKTISSPDVFGKWLSAVTRRMALEYNRKTVRNPVLYDLSDEADWRAQPLDYRLLYNERRTVLRACVKRMQPLRRKIVWAFYLRGLSINQVATEYSIKPYKVKEHLREGRLELRARLMKVEI